MPFCVQCGKETYGSKLCPACAEIETKKTSNDSPEALYRGTDIKIDNRVINYEIKMKLAPEVDFSTLPADQYVRIKADQKGEWLLKKHGDKILIWYDLHKGAVEIPIEGFLTFAYPKRGEEPQDYNGLPISTVTSKLKVGDNVVMPYFNYTSSGAVETPNGDSWVSVIAFITVEEK